MNRVYCRARDLLGEYPLTIAGVAVGLALAIILWTRQDAADRRVDRIEKRVVVVERHDRASARAMRGAKVCDLAHPHSAACVELRHLVVRLSDRERRQLPPGARRPTSAPPPRSGGATPTPAPSSPRPPAPPSAPQTGASVTTPHDQPTVKVQADPPKAEVHAPEVGVSTPAGDVKVPSVGVTTPSLPPLP